MVKKYSANLKNKFTKLYLEKDKNKIQSEQFGKDALSFTKDLIAEKNDMDQSKIQDGSVTLGSGANAAFVPQTNSFKINENELLARYKYSGGKKAKDNSLCENISTVMHESEHCRQFAATKETDVRKMNPNAICYAKEFLIIENNKNFYQENYNDLFIEAEARCNQYKETLEFLDDTILTKKHELKDHVKQLQKHRLQSDLGLKKINGYFKGDSPVCDRVSSTFTDAAKNTNKDAFKQILDKYPVLKLQYNEDGSKKSFDQIMAERENALKDNLHDTAAFQNIANVYKTIIETDKEYREEYNRRKNNESSNSEKDDATRGYERKPQNESYAEVDANKNNDPTFNNFEQEQNLPQPEIKPVGKEELEAAMGQHNEDSYGMEMDEEYKKDRQREELSRNNVQQMQSEEMQNEEMQPVQNQQRTFSRGR